MKFTLEIELGNDAMQTAEDVSRVLFDLSDAIVDYDLSDSDSGPGSVRDVNGNTVGHWDVTD
jgi:hypothetical protein